MHSMPNFFFLLISDLEESTVFLKKDSWGSACDTCTKLKRTNSFANIYLMLSIRDPKSVILKWIFILIKLTYSCLHTQCKLYDKYICFNYQSLVVSIFWNVKIKNIRIVY